MGAIFKEDEVAKIESDQKAWEKHLQEKLVSAPERKENYTTISGTPVKALYTPADISDFNYTAQSGFPGMYPYTRGVQASMYRGRLWTMRMFAGLGSAEETNRRFLYLVSQGQTGLSTAFDMPTLMGYDTGDFRARGECGTCGVAIDVPDMKTSQANLPEFKRVSVQKIFHGNHEIHQ